MKFLYWFRSKRYLIAENARLRQVAERRLDLLTTASLRCLRLASQLRDKCHANTPAK